MNERSYQIFGRIIFSVVLLFIFAFPNLLYSQNEEKLLDEFAKSKGESPIFFDSKNIKQFWTDTSVLCKDGSISVILKNNNQNWESTSFKIQLLNLIETQNCRIDVFSDTPNINFTVSNSNNKTMATSHNEDDFLQYHVASAVFHLEDTLDFSFFISFRHNTTEIIKIKKIILSFSNNPDSAFYGSPGFDALIELIDKEGVAVKDRDVSYYISDKNKKIYVKVPQEFVPNASFVYHIKPTNEKDLLSSKSSFNNCDISSSKLDKITTPIPFSSKSPYRILQIDMPTYEYNYIDMGQSKKGGALWRTRIKKASSSKTSK